MGTEAVCGHCGAPWNPDVTGACRFCRAVAPPQGTSPPGGAGNRPAIDADALCRLLLATTADPSRPLDALAADLKRVAGDRVTVSGTPVSHLDVALDDWRYQAGLEHGDVVAGAQHSVRGVVLKHETLAFDEWVACVAGHLAEFAATQRSVYDAIVTLDQA